LGFDASRILNSTTIVLIGGLLTGVAISLGREKKGRDREKKGQVK
jgi:hypothetical protein